MGVSKGNYRGAAKLIGIPFEEYMKNVNNGLKWCTGCKDWHKKSEFGADNYRLDGLASSCLAFRKRDSKRRYKPKPKKVYSGRRFVGARSGDKKQARRRVNYFVEHGIIPHPNRLPCVDCGHIWKENDSRHEYDHYLGYAAEHHEDVEVVCASCHRKRHPECVRRKR